MTVSIKRIKLELRSIRAQLEVIEAELSKLDNEESQDSKTFAQLRGIWKGANFTDEEIEAAKYRVKEFPKQ